MLRKNVIVLKKLKFSFKKRIKMVKLKSKKAKQKSFFFFNLE